MLKKLIKYDFKAIFKYWWIAALASTAISVLGGFCIRIISSEKQLPRMIDTIGAIGLVLVCFGFVAFILSALILTIKRFYTNFFTDEGYLTFTLPVKKSQLLNSKLITAILFQIMTGAVFIVNVVTMICIGASEYIFSQQFINVLKRFFELIAHIIDILGLYTPVYILEGIILLLLSLIFSTLFLFSCITFASVIAKKGRIIKAIAIYYIANSVLSFFIQIFLLFGVSAISRWYSVIPDNTTRAVIMLTFLTAIFFIALFCALVYCLQYRLIDKKLNLS